MADAGGRTRPRDDFTRPAPVRASVSAVVAAVLFFTRSRAVVTGVAGVLLPVTVIADDSRGGPASG